ncbi:MAG: PASTA domain-containing protein [Firmicutes bacterium]|nr:PASTA domain-containing protein [Bacillota bacterium]
MFTPPLSLRRRVVFLFFAFLVSFAVLAGRLGWLQVVKGEELRSRALQVRMNDIPVQARRGLILDRRGRELAISVDVNSVYAIPPEIRDVEKTARELGRVLGIPPQDVLDRLRQRSFYVWIRRRISEEEAAAVKALKLRGVGLTREAQRFYPQGQLAAHLLGIVGIDNVGLEGLELIYEKDLRGQQGRVVVEVDALGREIPQSMRQFEPPVPGNNLVLTIDQVLQYVCERELEAAMARTEARSGMVVMMDPTNGEILALAVRPTFDPGRYQEFPDSHRRNPVVSDTIPPGSTFKPITAAAALETGVVTPASGFFCGGSYTVPGHTFSCWAAGGHGAINFEQAVAESCNVAFIQMGLRVGVDAFYRYLDEFGLTQPTGTDAGTGEAQGLLLPKQECKPVDLAAMAFGQTLTVTPLQLCRAIAAIANGGVMTTPHVMKEIRTPSGELVRTYEDKGVRRVISEETARELVRAMGLVMEEGTGKSAQVPGYRLAGKTGTAQKVEEGRIAAGKYISSFVGFGPLPRPRLLTLVVLDEPKGEYYGSQVAAPVFRAIMADALRYLEIPPGEQPPAAPAAGPVSVAAAGAHGRGGPEAGTVGGAGATRGGAPARGEAGAAPAAASGTVEPGTVPVPDVRGMSMRAAARCLEQAGLRMVARGTGRAVRQDPGPGAGLPPGGTVQVDFAPPLSAPP